MLTRRKAIFGVAATGLATIAARNTELLAEVPQPSTALNFTPPAGATDTHRHVFGDPAKYPYAPTSGYRHEPAFLDEMKKLDSALRIDRSVLVQPSAYADDNRAMLDVMRAVGPRSIRGIVGIGDATTDATMDEWHRAGVRGVRVGIGGAAPEALQRLRSAASRISGHKWHINTAIGQIAQIEGLADGLAALSVPVVLDHYAGASASGGTTQAGFSTLLQLLKSGNVYVKLSRLHNLSTQAPGYADVRPLAEALVAASPRQLLWGTDWPHAGIRPPGYSATDVSPYFNYDDGLILNEFASWVGSPATLKTILVDNPARLYDFS